MLLTKPDHGKIQFSIRQESFMHAFLQTLRLRSPENGFIPYSLWPLNPFIQMSVPVYFQAGIPSTISLFLIVYRTWNCKMQMKAEFLLKMDNFKVPAQTLVMKVFFRRVALCSLKWVHCKKQVHQFFMPWKNARWSKSHHKSKAEQQQVKKVKRLCAFTAVRSPVNVLLRAKFSSLILRRKIISLCHFPCNQMPNHQSLMNRNTIFSDLIHPCAIYLENSSRKSG